jgi:succinate dehydrogenase / fumarate reductase membrane anchor subunit
MSSVSVRVPRARPGLDAGRLETLWWQFMRISGVALIPLAFGHLGIMHLVNSVADMNLCFVAARWDLLAWRLYDAALLGFAMLHGLNGWRYVLDDYVRNPGANRALKILTVVVGALVFLLGAVALVGGVRLAPLPLDQHCV